MIKGKKRLVRHGAAWKRLTRKKGGRPGGFRPAFQPLEQRRLLALVISEIMYNPSSDDDDWEWIELHNNGAEAVDLSGYVMDDNNNSPLAEANIAAGMIAAGESAVLHSSTILAADFEAAWGPGVNLIAVPSFPRLGNGGDGIGIWASFDDYDGDHIDHLNAVDDVSYDDLAPWPIEDEGVSIYLTDPSLDNSMGDNWAISQPNIGGGGQSVFTNGNSGGEVGSPGVIPGDPRIVVIQTNAFTSVVEGGADDQYTIGLARIPSNPVDVTINAGVEVEVSLDGNNFAASQVLTLNDAAPQTVMVRAIDDLALEGGHSAVITHSVTAASPEYPAGAPVADVRVNVTDNDDVPVELLITEIMYNPDSSDNSWEWIEIYNNGAENVDLAGFVFDDNNGTSHDAANIAEGVVLPGETAILHNSNVTADNFRGAWTAGLNLIAVDNWSRLSLGNGGDRIGIWSSFAAYLGDHQAHNNVVEGVEYFDDEMFWPVDVPGSSIYLTNLESANNDGANWATSIEDQLGAIRSTNAGGNLGNDVGSPGLVPIEPVAPGVSVISPDAQTKISEDGLQDEYAIRLNTLPAGSVRIEISVDVGGEPQSEISLDGVNFAGAATLSFNSVTGTTPQTVYVRAIDDAETEGVHESVLSHRITVTGDPDNYPPANVDPDFIADLHVLVTDNDPPSSPLIITEIMYAPSGDPEEDWEWVEVYNSGDAPIDLNGYVLDDDDGTALTEPNIGLEDSVIPAGGIGLLYNWLHEGFEPAWQIEDDIAVIPVDPIAWSGLSNGGERISLWDSFALYAGDHQNHNNAVLSVDYNDAAPWPEDPDGASIYLKDFSGGPRRIADSFNGGLELDWTFVSDAGAVASPNPSRVEVVGDLLQIEANADDLPGAYHEYVSAFTASHEFEDVIVRATTFPLDTAGGAPTVSGGTANSNNDQFVTARVNSDGQDGYLLVFDYGTKFLNLARSDNGVVFVPQTGVDGDNVSLTMGDDIDPSQPYAIELELVGDSITGRVLAVDGVTLLYEVQWTDDVYDEGRVGFGAAINADLAPPNGATATFLSAGFDDFSAVALNEVSNGAAWALSELGIDGAIQGTFGDVGSPGVLLPPKVEKVEINGGIADPADLPSGPQPAAWSTQRSDLRSILVTFSEPVQVAAADLVLTNLGRDAANDPDVIVELDDAQLTLEDNLLTITFASYQLEDGVYQLEILGSVTDAFDSPLDGNGDGVAGDDFVYAGNDDNGFYKLGGDFNGDRGTSIFDFPVFAYWFGRAVPLAPEYADINQDLGVSIFDFPNFALNFGAGVVFPAAMAAAAPSFGGGEQAASVEGESLVEANPLIDRSFASLWRVDSAPRRAQPAPARPAGSPTAALDAALEDLMRGETAFIW